MTSPADLTNPWEVMVDLAVSQDAEALESLVESIGPAEAFRALLRLTASDREKVLTTLSPEDAADLIEEIPDQHAADLIEQLPVENAASIIAEMPSADQADVLSELSSSDAQTILAAMEPEVASDAQQLIGYAGDVAGGLMSREFLSFHENATVSEIIDQFSDSSADESTGDTMIHVVSQNNKYMGATELRVLFTTPLTSRISDLVVSTVSTDTQSHLDDLRELFHREELNSVPVVDDERRLVGVIRRNDLDEALSERSDSDLLKSRGIVRGDEIRAMPVITRARRRLAWLSLNIVLNIIAASVIAFYQDTISAVIALAVFLPIVSDMSGCSGNQAVAVSMRELSLGIVKPHEVVMVWLQEIKVGLINGVMLGTLIAAVAYVWKANAYLGLVVGGALAANTLVAVSIGGTVPLLLKRFDIVPAVASGPILTTATDMCGFFLLLFFATLLLPQLTMT